jgi:catechol 2,3-dioxygenase-like lactoylglutathione lyase family enzyme
MAMTNDQAVRITSIHTVGVPVADQDKALAFYTGTLGLTTRMDVPMGGGSRWIEVLPEDGLTSIALVPAKDSAPAGVETGVRFVATDADAFHARLEAAGVDAEEVLRWPGVPPMFAFRDQDGNRLEVVQQS